VTRLGLILITVVHVNQTNLIQMGYARIVLMVVAYAADWELINVKAVLTEHGKCILH
jgi:hypothetical protein